MKFFVDTADIEEVKAAGALGLADGVTTNPTLIQKSGRDFRETIVEIADLIEGPVNAEVVSTDAEGIVKEGREMGDSSRVRATVCSLTRVKDSISRSTWVRLFRFRIALIG